jgi:hypothetical protein
MDKYLQKHGFSSVQHLDGTVQSVLKGEELQKWQDLKKALLNPFYSTSLCANNYQSQRQQLYI